MFAIAVSSTKIKAAIEIRSREKCTLCICPCLIQYPNQRPPQRKKNQMAVKADKAIFTMSVATRQDTEPAIANMKLMDATSNIVAT